MDQTTIVIFGDSDNPQHILRLNVPKGQASAVADTINELLMNTLGGTSDVANSSGVAPL